MDLESRLVWCMVNQQGLSEADATKNKFGNGSEQKSNLEALAAYVTSQSRGVKMNVSLDEPHVRDMYALGEKMFFYRGGTHDFACATCHGEDGKRIRLQDLPNLTKIEGAQKAYTTWPAYRVSQGELRTFQWRLNDCFRQQRFPELEFGSDASHRADDISCGACERRAVRRSRDQALKECDACMTHRSTNRCRCAAAALRASPACSTAAPTMAPSDAETSRARRGGAEVLRSRRAVRRQLDRLDQDETQRAVQRVREPAAAGVPSPRKSSRRISRRSSCPADGKSCRRLEERREDRAERAGLPVFRRSEGRRRRQLLHMPPACAEEVVVRHDRAAPLSLRQAARIHRRDAQVRLGQDLQRQGLQRLLEHAARSAHRHILTEQQISDVVALLVDPASPVNQ